MLHSNVVHIPTPQSALISTNIITSTRCLSRGIDINMWLQVIAKIKMPGMKVSGLIKKLLTDVGKHHLQAITYPFIVASKFIGVRLRYHKRPGDLYSLQSVCKVSSSFYPIRGSGQFFFSNHLWFPGMLFLLVSR